MVQSIEEIFDHAHGGGRVFEFGAATEAGPVRGLRVLDGIEAAVCQYWKQDRKGGPDLLRAVTSIVDDDLQWAMPPGDDAQEVGVSLVALIGEDAFLIEEGSVAEVQSDDLSFRKEVLPHSQ